MLRKINIGSENAINGQKRKMNELRIQLKILEKDNKINLRKAK